MTGPQSDAIATSSPRFKMVFITVVVIFGISFVAWTGLGLYLANPSAHQTTVLDGLDWVVKLTLGAIVGLLGGKAA